jgi:L-erythro-3,5-diaminohexanoate dehydrogenase
MQLPTGRKPMTEPRTPSPVGLHRVLEPAGALPQAADRLDADPGLAPDEVRVRVERLNLDAASFRQLTTKHGGDGDAVRSEVLDIIATRGKMQNPVTGSGGMLVGVVDEVGPSSTLGLTTGDRVATLVSLSLTPLRITDGLVRWDGASEQVPAEGTAILFGRSIAARIPDDLPNELSMAVMDVCGAPALTARVVERYVRAANSQLLHDRLGEDADPHLVHDRLGEGDGGRLLHDRLGEEGVVRVAVIGGAGKSGSMSLAAARRTGAAAASMGATGRAEQTGAAAASMGDVTVRTVGVVPVEREAVLLREVGLADHVALADARDPVALAAAVQDALRGPADVTVVCVDVPGCEHGAILATADGGTVIFFSMATSFSAAALGAEGLAADVTMLVGNGYVPGHAAYAMDLLRTDLAVRTLFERRLSAEL